MPYSSFILIIFYQIIVFNHSYCQHLSLNKKTVSVGIIFPKEYGSFHFVSRMFIKSSKSELKDIPRILFKHYTLRNVTTFLKQSSYPMTLLNVLCDEMIQEKVVAIIYLANWETYDNSSACVQYFMHLASYSGIPIIAWNADNSGLLVNRVNKINLIYV